MAYENVQDKKSLQEKAVQQAAHQGVFWGGVADLSGGEGLEAVAPSTGWSGFPRAVSLLCPMSYGLVDAIPSGEVSVAFTYSVHYQALNQALDQAALRVAQVLEAAGYLSVPVPASQPLPPDRLTGLFSHKLAAHLAGSGWIGRHALLITPWWGDRVRLSTVLTDAPLPARRNLSPSHCGRCMACVRACPAGAIRGRLFSPDEGVDQRVDVQACRSYLEERQKNLELPQSSTACGRCLQVCPQAPPLQETVPDSQLLEEPAREE